MAPGLTKSAHRRAAHLGPRAIVSTRSLDVSMNAAGFVDVEVTDMTQEFLDTARAWNQRMHERTDVHQLPVDPALAHSLSFADSHPYADRGGPERTSEPERVDGFERCVTDVDRSHDPGHQRHHRLQGHHFFRATMSRPAHIV
jgi:hypothetical protein